MKYILAFIFFSLSNLAMSQDKHEWADRVAGKFYTRINPSKNFDCCDTIKSKDFVEISYDLPETCYPFRADFKLDCYYDEYVDDKVADIISAKLAKIYYRRYSFETMQSFHKSCYQVYIQSHVIDDIVDDYIMIKGTVYFKFFFNK
jgi:hypothetical protein